MSHPSKQSFERLSNPGKAIRPENAFENLASLTTTVSKPASEKQLMQRARFKLMISFLNSLSGFLISVFSDPSMNKNVRNEAISYNMLNAITGDYPYFTIDYPEVMLTRGYKLPNADNPNADSPDTGIVQFTWKNNEGNKNAVASDHAILVVHCPALNQSIYNMFGPSRSEEHSFLKVPQFAGMEVHTWLSFRSQNGQRVSDSVYTGKFIVR